jgi:outer membrane protein assembly factor BamB
MILEISTFSQVAVIPIVVNAGAALLPAILAAVATFVALLFKPRELLRVCRAKPHIPLVVLALCAGIWALIAFWPSVAPAATSGRRAAAPAASFAGAPVGGQGVYVDWTRIALARIEARKNGTAPVAAPLTNTTPAPAQRDAFIFRGGVTRLGSIGDPPAAGLKQAWKHYPSWIDENGTPMEDTEAMILSSPAVHGSKVFAGSCLLDPPENFGILFCLDATSGKQLWSTDKINGKEMKGFFSSPAVTADGRYVIVGQGLHPDSNCNLICADAQTGRIAWTLQVPMHIESSPAIEGDVVYVGVGAIEDPATKKPISHPGFLIAVRISDGKEIWRHDINDPESSPAVKDGIVYIGSGFNGKAIAAFRTGTDEELKQRGESRELWKTETPYPVTGAITVLNDMVIAGGGNGDFALRDPNPAGVVTALDRQTGKRLWEAAMPDAVLGAVAASESLLICPVANGEVVALNPKDGSRVWATRISGSAPVLAAPAISGDQVFAVSNDGYLARLNLKDGSLLEKVYINSTEKPGSQGFSISSPFVASGSVILGSETGGLRSYTGGAK